MQFLKIFRLGAYRHLRRYISVEIAQPFFHDFSTKKYLNTHLWATKRKTIEFLRLLGKKSTLVLNFGPKSTKIGQFAGKNAPTIGQFACRTLSADIPHPLCWFMLYAVKIVYFETKFDKVIKKYLSAHLRRAIFYPFVQIYPLQAKKNRWIHTCTTPLPPGG